MRSIKEIKQKRELMIAPNWPEGAAAAALLLSYLAIYPVIDYGAILNDLQVTVKKAYKAINDNRPMLEVTTLTVEAITIVWMLGDDKFVGVLQNVQFEYPPVNKLVAIKLQYDIDVEGE